MTFCDCGNCCRFYFFLFLFDEMLLGRNKMMTGAGVKQGW